MKRCRLLKEANLDLVEIARYISLDDSDAAGRVIEAILDSLARIEHNADLGHQFDEELENILYTQASRPARMYIIIYQVRMDYISVFGVLHASRDWQTEIRRRLKR